MTVRRDQDIVLLEGACGVEDAEILMQEIQAGAAHVDWSGCDELHSACLQVLLAARPPLCGTPPNAQLAQWLGPILSAPPPPVPTRTTPRPSTSDPVVA